MIKIICVGKIKENFFREAILEYKKRLSKYCKLEIIEVNDEEHNSLEKEKNNILKYVKKTDYNIVLDVEGNRLTSNEFAVKLDKVFIENSNITFIIGGSLGLHEEIKDLSNYKLSFSDLTFPHQLFRVILLEQVYRCFKILNNESYHK